MGGWCCVTLGQWQLVGPYRVKHCVGVNSHGWPVKGRSNK